MKIYNTENIELYTDNDSIFAHRDVTEAHEERVRIKNAVMETILDNDSTLSKTEKEYWILYRRGIKNRDIANEMGITAEYCRLLKYRATKKIEKIASKLKKKLG